MPHTTSGFTGNEIVERVIKFVGNRSLEFKTFVQDTLPIAESRFYKLHDWSFLYKTGLSLSITNGTAEYDLDTSTIGYYMAANDIETIYHEADGLVLKRVELNQIRRYDPDNADGSSTDTPRLWAVAGDNKIRIWPPNIETGTLKIDGKITPTLLNTTDGKNIATYSDIPMRYQESFMCYLTALVLDRENDSRAPNKIREAMAMIEQDVKDDLRQLANTTNPRLKHFQEVKHDGVGSGEDAWLWAWWNSDY
jgi:hypothetical protein